MRKIARGNLKNAWDDEFGAARDPSAAAKSCPDLRAVRASAGGFWISWPGRSCCENFALDFLGVPQGRHNVHRFCTRGRVFSVAGARGSGGECWQRKRESS